MSKFGDDIVSICSSGLSRPSPDALAVSMPARPASAQALPGSDLGAALKSYRTQRANELSQPPYCVFTNAELDVLVATCPRSTAELSRIKGFGPSKMSKFGDDIVSICSSGLSRPSPDALAVSVPAPARPASAQAPPSSDLGAALKSYRTQRSSELAQPPYCVFTNAELDALVAPACKPQS